MKEAYTIFRLQFEKINFIYSIASFVALEIWQKDCDKIVGSLIHKHSLSGGEEERIRASIYKPWKKTALVEIQEKLSSGASSKDLARDYAFLRSWSVVWYKPLDESWFTTPVIKKEQDLTYSFEKIKDTLKPSPEEEKFLVIAPFMTFFKDWRDDIRRKHCYAWSFLFDILSKKWNMERDDIGYLTLDEIQDAISSSPNTKTIEKRKKPFIMTTSKKGVHILDGVSKNYQHIIEETVKKSHKILLKGITAYGGVVHGPVVLLRSHHDIKKVREGDILIANTTHPDYIPAMNRAAAFVTNEGGMLSHAAIVAREMKKPCIVGTNSATEIFKDGDIVEVDATNGIVRKI